MTPRTLADGNVAKSTVVTSVSWRQINVDGKDQIHPRSAQRLNHGLREYWPVEIGSGTIATSAGVPLQPRFGHEKALG